MNCFMLKSINFKPSKKKHSMNKNLQGIFPICYFAPINYYYYLLQYPHVTFDIHEHFVKQTFRNRCQILSPNGVQNLSIPIKSVKKRKTYWNTQISNTENWQILHWRSLEAAYRSSPYFEYYEDHFALFFLEKQFDFLHEITLATHELVAKLIQLPVKHQLSESFVKTPENTDDFRGLMSPSKLPKNLELTPYIQVFSDRHPFTTNLSILDLLFNQGPNTLSYLKGLNDS